ncbi:MAG: hypothetical protein N2A42_12570, partial [Luteolibacter sp.]
LVRGSRLTASDRFIPSLAALLHIRNLDVLLDAPEIPGAFIYYLHLHGFRGHLVKRPQIGGVDEHPAVAGFVRKSIFHGELVVGVFLVGEQVAARAAERNKQPVADDEARVLVLLAVGSGNIRMPSDPPLKPVF